MMYPPIKPERSQFETFETVSWLHTHCELTKEQILKIDFDLLRRKPDRYSDDENVEFVKRGKFDQKGYDTAIAVYEQKKREYDEWKTTQDRQQYEILKKKFEKEEMENLAEHDRWRDFKPGDMK